MARQKERGLTPGELTTIMSPETPDQPDQKATKVAQAFGKYSVEELVELMFLFKDKLADLEKSYRYDISGSWRDGLTRQMVIAQGVLNRMTRDRIEIDVCRDVLDAIRAELLSRQISDIRS